ncbi:hypothetical protein OAE85_00655 [Akkermansiaceae bacterium]|nr:hypothetical protein [Akkermansiaceae bacterium]
MAKSAEMDAKAKDIAALFRSAVEAEDKALLGDTSTFAEQDFFIQLGWFTDQIVAFSRSFKSTSARCFRFARPSRTERSKVVFPAPKKPVSRSSGRTATTGGSEPI